MMLIINIANNFSYLSFYAGYDWPVTIFTVDYIFPFTSNTTVCIVTCTTTICIIFVNHNQAFLQMDKNFFQKQGVVKGMGNKYDSIMRQMRETRSRVCCLQIKYFETAKISVTHLSLSGE